jgi:hypothetical protein
MHINIGISYISGYNIPSLGRYNILFPGTIFHSWVQYVIPGYNRSFLGTILFLGTIFHSWEQYLCHSWVQYVIPGYNISRHGYKTTYPGIQLFTGVFRIEADAWQHLQSFSRFLSRKPSATLSSFARANSSTASFLCNSSGVDSGESCKQRISTCKGLTTSGAGSLKKTSVPALPKPDPN